MKKLTVKDTFENMRWLFLNWYVGRVRHLSGSIEVFYNGKEQEQKLRNNLELK